MRRESQESIDTSSFSGDTRKKNLPRWIREGLIGLTAFSVLTAGEMAAPGRVNAGEKGGNDKAGEVEKKSVSGFRDSFLKEIQKTKGFDQEQAAQFFESVAQQVEHNFGLRREYAASFLEWFCQGEISTGSSKTIEEATNKLIFEYGVKKEAKDGLISAYQNQENLKAEELGLEKTSEGSYFKFKYDTKSNVISVDYMVLKSESDSLLKEGYEDIIKERALSLYHKGKLEKNLGQAEYAWVKELKMTAQIVAQHELTLKYLEEKGSGDSPEADYLRMSIETAKNKLRPEIKDLIK